MVNYHLPANIIHKSKQKYQQGIQALQLNYNYNLRATETN